MLPCEHQPPGVDKKLSKHPHCLSISCRCYFKRAPSNDPVETPSRRVAADVLAHFLVVHPYGRLVIDRPEVQQSPLPGDPVGWQAALVPKRLPRLDQLADTRQRRFRREWHQDCLHKESRPYCRVFLFLPPNPITPQPVQTRPILPLELRPRVFRPSCSRIKLRSPWGEHLPRDGFPFRRRGLKRVN